MYDPFVRGMVQVKMTVNFIVPQSFLRTAAKTDPFYDPIIRAIDGRNDFDWKVYVWNADVECGYTAEHVGDYRLLQTCATWFYRVCRLVAWKVQTWKIYYLFGRLARPVFSRKFKADVVITQAGQFAEVLAGLLPRSRIIDIQHGVLYSRHRGYFDETQRLLPIYQALKRREFWVYGQGFAGCFFKHPDNANDLQGRVKVIGDVIRAVDHCVAHIKRVEKRLIVIASQMTTDFSNETLAALKKIYEEAFMQTRAYGTVVFRHHPRFNACMDLDDWKEKFPWVVTDDTRTWPELFAASICTMTISSTTAFDAAAYGVPTILLDGTAAGWANMMVDEYKYPLEEMTVGQYCNMDYIQQSSVRDKVREWYRRFYSPFTEENCMRLLIGKQKRKQSC